MIWRSRNRNEFVTLAFTLAVIFISSGLACSDGTPPKLADQDVEEVKSSLTFDRIKGENKSQDKVIEKLELFRTTDQGVSIVWSSNKPSVINPETGDVTRPMFSESNVKVTLQAKLQKKDATDIATFEILVLKKAASSEQLIELAYEHLTFEKIKNRNQTRAKITTNLTLPQSLMTSVKIDWDSTNPEIISTSGHVNRPQYGSADETITISATFSMLDKSKGSSSKKKKFELTVPVSPPTDAQAVEEAKREIKFETIKSSNLEASSISQDLNLPSKWDHGVFIEWSSDNKEIIDPDSGIVKRPQSFTGDQTINLIARIKKGHQSTQKTFTVTVLQEVGTDKEAVNFAIRSLTDSIILNGNSDFQNVTSDLKLPTSGQEGVTIQWQSFHHSISISGSVIRPTHLENDANVKLIATFSKNSESHEKIYSIKVIKTPKTKEQSVAGAKQALTFEMIKNQNDSHFEVHSNLNLIDSIGNDGVTITWNSDKEDLISSTGKVTRPEWDREDVGVELTATLSKDGYEETKRFPVIVIGKPETDQQAVHLAYRHLSKELIAKDNDNLEEVRSDLNLIQNWSYNVSITWRSEDPLKVSPTGHVYLPRFKSGDDTVKLEATISRGSINVQKDFIVTLKESSPTDSEAVNEAMNHFTLQEVFGDDFQTKRYQITSNLNLPHQGLFDVRITWSSSKPSILNRNGIVVRPPYKKQDTSVDLKAYFSRGSASTAIKSFVVKVLKSPPPPKSPSDMIAVYVESDGHGGYGYAAVGCKIDGKINYKYGMKCTPEACKEAGYADYMNKQQILDYHNDINKWMELPQGFRSNLRYGDYCIKYQ